jgi:FtsZ-binding cell division protein ZapB
MQHIHYDAYKPNQVEQAIDAMVNSNEYKELKHKNRAAAVPAPTNQEKGKRKLLKERLASLEDQKKFWQEAVLSSDPVCVKKHDSARKHYTRQSAALPGACRFQYPPASDRRQAYNCARARVLCQKSSLR